MKRNSTPLFLIVTGGLLIVGAILIGSGLVPAPRRALPALRLPAPSPTPTPRPTPTHPPRQRVTIDPYPYSVSIPADWHVASVHYAGVTHEHCADYTFTSPGGTVSLEIDEFCGEGSPGFVECSERDVIGFIGTDPVARLPRDWAGAKNTVRYYAFSGFSGCAPWIWPQVEYPPLMIDGYFYGADADWPRARDELDRIVLSFGR